MTSNILYSINNSESLKFLENLMSEFFHENTSNQRKRQIEEILEQFAQQQDSWRHCIGYLIETQNEYAMIYCLSVLDNFISKKWINLGADKTQFRMTIWNYLLTRHRCVPIYIRNKICKLIVNIAKNDWPHDYSDFINNMIELLNSRETMVLGLMLIQTAIEELTAESDDICVARRDQLTKLLTNEINLILASLTNVMEVILDKFVNFLTATPPPSPTQSLDSQEEASFGKSDVLCSAFEISLRKGLLHSIPEMDEESMQLSSQALSCLNQIFCWIPSCHYHQINNSLLAAIFVFATFSSSNNQALNYEKCNYGQIGAQAMSCINELMSKNYISIESTQFIFHIFQNTFHLLQKLIKNDKSCPKEVDFKCHHQDYIDKFTEFLRIFISSHFQKFEDVPSFPLMEFLGLLFQYTFIQTSCDSFISALEIWTILMDYILIKTKQSSNPSQIIEKYKEPIVSLLTSLIKKIEFKNSKDFLDELDDQNVDDDYKTEWQRFLEICIELIAKISEILPLQTYELANYFYQENINSYCRLELLVENDNLGKRKLNIINETDMTRLDCMLRDLSTALKLIGRLSYNTTAENFPNWFQLTKLVVDKLVESLVISNKQQFYNIELSSSMLLVDLVEVHAQIIASIKAYCHWISQYYNQNQTGQNSDSISMITTIIENCIEIIICDKKFPPKVIHSALHCFNSFTVTIRPVFLFNLGCVQLIYTKISNLFKHELKASNGFKQDILCLSSEDKRLLCRSISNILLLPWPYVNDNSQDWKSRTMYHDSFIQAIMAPLITFVKSNPPNGNPSADYPRIYNISHEPLQLLIDIIENHRESPTRSKQLLYKSIQEPMEMLINFLLNNFSNYQIAEDCLCFFTTVFDVLRNQINLQFVERAIQMMLNLFAHNNDSNLTDGNELKSKVIESFLNILTFVVQQPQFKSLLPGILSFCINNIHPFVLQCEFTELKKSLFNFLHQLLLNNWKYFFPNNLSETFYRTNNQHKEQLQNEHEFVRIMDMFGQSFLQNDIHVFKHNLDVLENLNLRLKLYNKEIFKSSMLRHFLYLFIQALLTKSLTLFQDDLFQIIYHLASVDFDNFFINFIPQFLYDCDDLNDDQRNVLATKSFKTNETDFPSFVSNLSMFINDLRYYRLCNNLHSGSIQLC